MSAIRSGNRELAAAGNEARYLRNVSARAIHEISTRDISVIAGLCTLVIALLDTSSPELPDRQNTSDVT